MQQLWREGGAICKKLEAKRNPKRTPISACRKPIDVIVRMQYCSRSRKSKKGSSQRPPGSKQEYNISWQLMSRSLSLSEWSLFNHDVSLHSLWSNLLRFQPIKLRGRWACGSSPSPVSFGIDIHIHLRCKHVYSMMGYSRSRRRFKSNTYKACQPLPLLSLLSDREVCNKEDKEGTISLWVNMYYWRKGCFVFVVEYVGISYRVLCI